MPLIITGSNPARVQEEYQAELARRRVAGQQTDDITLNIAPLGSSFQPFTPGVAGMPVDTSGLPPKDDDLLNQIDQFIKKLLARGETINPNVEISPDKLVEFMSQASREIDPYYQSQLKLAKDDLLRSLGYSQSQILEQEKNLEAQYGRTLQQEAEGFAEQGFAQSGRRLVSEERLAQDTQRQIDINRRNLSFGAGNLAGAFAREWGTPGVAPTISSAPRVLAGSPGFQYSGNQSLYELSPGVYDGLVGSKQFEQTAAKRTLSAELESAFRSKLANQQQRTLIL